MRPVKPPIWSKVVKGLAVGEYDLYILDQILDDYEPWSWIMGITPQGIVNSLNRAAGATTINVHINSPGGSVAAGMAIYSLLKNHPAKIVTKIHGQAASMGSVIALAGDERLISPGGQIMIHDPWLMTIGDESEHNVAISMLQAAKESLINIYENETGLDRDAIGKLMSEQTWMTAQRAIEFGFAHKTFNAPKMAAMFVPESESQLTENMSFTKLNAALKLTDGATEEAMLAALNAAILAARSEGLSEGVSLAATHLKAVSEPNKVAFDALVKTNPQASLTLLSASNESEKPAVTIADLSGVPKPAQGEANGESGNRADWTFQAWREKDAAGLQLMQTKEPEKFQKLVADAVKARN